MSKITITVELEEYQAEALAQFIKRATYYTCESLAVRGNKEETYAMLEGLGAVRRGLDEAGFSPA